MPIIGDYPEFFVNYKGEIVKRVPDSELPKLGAGMEDPYNSRNMNMREKYNENRRIARMEKAKLDRYLRKKNNEDKE